MSSFDEKNAAARANDEAAARLIRPVNFQTQTVEPALKPAAVF
jgi:hypothetical protein